MPRAWYTWSVLTALRSSWLVLAVGSIGLFAVSCGGSSEREHPGAQGGAGGTGGNEAGAAGCEAAECGGSAGKASGGSAGASGAAGSSSALDVRISEVSLSQALKVPLFADGAPAADAPAPIVAGKDGILRVYVEPGDGFTRQDLIARLDLALGSGTLSQSSRKFIAGPSSDGDPRTSFNFPLGGDALVQGTRFAVVLATGDGTELPETRVPATGTREIAVESSNGNLKVMLVPLVVNGFTPDLGTVATSRFRRRLEALFPVPEVELAVRAPIVLDYDVRPDGDEWNLALDDLYSLRSADAPPDDVFYYGVLTPKASFEQYCYVDCTVGLAIVGEPDEVEYRGAIGTGFFADGSGQDAPDTLVHEIGHALGRGHSPCGTSDADPFPYPAGDIGVWGYDMERRLPLDPAKTFDVMGYCSPVWISDFTYVAVLERLRFVNAPPLERAARAAPASELYRVIVVGADGRLRWGRGSRRRAPPRGETVTITLLDAAGIEISNQTGYFRRFDHRPGGFLVVAARALSVPGAVALRVTRFGGAILWL